MRNTSHMSIYLDHSLEMALDRMGALGVGILPVTDRTNVRQVKAVILLDDIIQSCSRNYTAPRGKTHGRRPRFSWPSDRLRYN